MKKLLLLITLLLLASCGSQNNWKLTVNTWEWEKITHSKFVSGAKISSWDVKTKLKIKSKKNTFVIIKKELDKEFKNIWVPEDLNHYVNSCYLLLDTDYKNKQFVLYRNKWAGLWTLWCKLDWVEKIWILWYHNGKKDPDGEYILKSYNKETGMFKYAISEKYWNLWDWNNEYEFRFYFKDGRVLKEKLNRKINTEELEKDKIYKIIKKEWCWAWDFDMSKIPTESWWKIDLICVDTYWNPVDDRTLEYRWKNVYILIKDWLSGTDGIYSVYIKNWKITKEWYHICWKWFKKIYDFWNLTWELAVWDLWNLTWERVVWDLWDNKCKFIDILSWSKYSWYYVRGELLQINNKNEIENPKYNSLLFGINGNQYRLDRINWNNATLSLNFDPTKKVNVIIKRYWNNFLLFSWNNVIIIEHDDGAYQEAWYWRLYKTFLNWKEVK